VRRLLAAAAGLYIPVAMSALPDEPTAWMAGFTGSRDSENLLIEQRGAGGAWWYLNPDRMTGVWLHELRVAQDGWKISGQQGAFQFKKRYREGWLHAEAGVAHLGRTFWSGAFSRGWFDATGRSTEIFAERSMIDSRAGIQKGISGTLVGGAIDRPLGPRVNTSVYAAVQYMEDNNWRGHARLKLSVTLSESPSTVEAQLRYRMLRASHSVSQFYFNPRSFEELLVGPQFRVDRNDWRFMLWAGTGPQRINGLHKNAYAIEARILSPRLVEAEAHASLTAGMRRDGARGTGYYYKYIAGNVAYKF
jgi:hypothetical protein